MPVSKILPNPNQPRKTFADDEMEELASSIREHGILQPLLIQPGPGGDYILVSGERRLRAASIAGLSSVPAVLIDPAKPDASLTIALVENIQRTDLNPLELARAFKKLEEEYGRTQEEIARMVGKSRSHVSNTVRLLDLPEEIQQGILDGTITAGHARAILMAPREARKLIYERIKSGELNVRQTERIAKKESASPKRTRKAKPGTEDTDVNIQTVIKEMELDLMSRYSRKVIIERKQEGSGWVTMQFYNDRDLQSLVEKLRRQI